MASVVSRLMILHVLGASFSLIECASCQPVSRTQWLLCADPLFLVHHWWLDSGTALSSLTHSSRRINLFSNLFDQFVSLFWLMIVNVFVAFHEWELSFSRRCSWLKGEPPGTRTLAAGIKKMSLDEWYAGVYALPTVWPDVSMLGASNLRRVVGYDFHHIRKKYDVPSMWGNIYPQWRLLQQHLETKGPGWYPLAEREERLFTNRSNRPGDDMKDELRTDSDPTAWRIWSTSQNQLWQLRQPAPPLEFPGEQGMLTNMYAQVREEEQVISLQFICSQQDVSKSRRKKRKQVDDGTAIV